MSGAMYVWIFVGVGIALMIAMGVMCIIADAPCGHNAYGKWHEREKTTFHPFDPNHRYDGDLDYDYVRMITYSSRTCSVCGHVQYHEGEAKRIPAHAYPGDVNLLSR